MADFARELVEAVRKAFTRNCKSDIVIAGIGNKLKEQGVSYKEAEEYAARLGEMLAKAYQETLSPDVLPDGRIDEELAEALIRQLVTQNYEEAARVAAQVQTSLNRAAGLGMNGLQPEVNRDRIDGLIQKTASYDSYEKQAWMLDEPIVNCTQSAVEDTIRKNADAHFRTGLHPKIKRISVGGCCKWCNSLAGTYDYPVPREIYRRHERCRCLVLYDPGDGKVQNSHSKKNYDSAREALDEEEKNRRIEELERQRKKEAMYPAGRKEIRERIKSGQYSLELRDQKYLQHIRGTAQFEETEKGRGRPQSYLTISKEEAIQIIERYSGLGDPDFYEDGRVMDVEYFSTGQIIGYFAKNGEYYPTDRVAICHSKKGTHIYPVNPNGRKI